MKKLFYFKSSYWLLFFLFWMSARAFGQNFIIPTPVSYSVRNGYFTIDNSVYILASNKSILPQAKLLASFIEKQGGVSLPQYSSPISDKNKRKIHLKLSKAFDQKIGREGYLLNVYEDSVIVEANTAAGIWNAAQSIKQMALVNSLNSYAGALRIPSCSITDYPAYSWRGLMLDVCRHFFTKEEVKSFIDMMAMYKFNTFHWHLSDDQGWRIEIKSLPQLTKVGAWRVKRFGGFGDQREWPKEGEPSTEGGFYTQSDVKEVIEYAAERNIEVVPEIEMPGHALAALASYPELSITGEKNKVAPGTKFAEWYGDGTFKMIVDNTFDPTNPKVYDFVKKVMKELSKLFPSKYIHMGGDECYHGYWEQSPKGKEFMSKHGLKNGNELQAYFVSKVNDIIRSFGKKMIGWDEILEGGEKELDTSAIVMSWRGVKGGIEAAKKHHYVIMSPTTYAYLDYTQGDPTIEYPIYKELSLRKTYEFNPTPEGVDSHYILGGQGNLWTEQIPTIEHAFYMVYPRAFCIAENTWTGVANKDWNKFLSKIETHFGVFDKLGKNISKAIYDPIIDAYMKDSALYCRVHSDVPGVDIYYTINNTFPGVYSPKVTEADIFIPKGKLSIKAVSYRNGKPIGRMLSIDRSELLNRAKANKKN